MSLVKHWLLVVLMVCFCSTGFTSPVASDSLAFLPDFSDMFPWMIEEETTESSKKITDQEEGKEYNKEVDEKTKGTDKQDVDTKSIDLVVILDKSGSMYNLRSDTIGGFNSLLAEQRKKDVPIKVSVGMFNQALESKYDRVELSEIKDMTEKDYLPQGTTALLDAVGNTLSALRGREEVNAEGNKVLVVIITDGLENASKEWKKPDVKKLISDLQEEKGYEFVFLGADIDAVSVAQGIGIKSENSMKFQKSSAGVRANFTAVSRMVDTVSEGASLTNDSSWKKSIVEDKN